MQLRLSHFSNFLRNLTGGTMKAALIQMDIVWNQFEENLNRAQTLATQAVDSGAQLIVLPEMFICGFSFLQGADAQIAGEKAFDWLMDFAGRHGVWICGSAPDSDDGSWERPLNTLALFGPAGLVGKYSKLHLFSFGGEGDKYRAGNELLTVRLGEWRVSFFICYDLRFPEPFAALATETDLYVVVANWPQARREHWCTLLGARAIENQAYVVAVNRVGEGGGLRYVGDSRVISPTGGLISNAGEVQGCQMADLDLKAVWEYREKFSVLRDRRPSNSIVYRPPLC